MAVAIRLSRGGAKKRPYYKIVVADSRNARDGKFIERIGSYNPLLAKDDPDRVKLDTERAKHWLSVGAQPSDRVHRFLDAAGVLERPARSNLKKGEPGEKAKERVEERATKETAAAEAAAAAAAEPEVEEPAVEEAAADAPAEETVEAAAEDAPADRLPLRSLRPLRRLRRRGEAPRRGSAPEDAAARKSLLGSRGRRARRRGSRSRRRSVQRGRIRRRSGEGSTSRSEEGADKARRPKSRLIGRSGHPRRRRRGSRLGGEVRLKLFAEGLDSLSGTRSSMRRRGR